jgi:hypothetical protein
MNRFRQRWLALFGGVTLIALSLAPAFAGRPDGTNRGLQVSAYVHSLVGDVEETADQADEETETEDDTEVTDPETAPSDHGHCVAEVAGDEEAVGPPNDNHGGAVSEAARDTCWTDEASGESAGDDSSEDDSADAEDSQDSEDSEAADDAAESDAGSEHGHGHDGDHGSDDSED